MIHESLVKGEKKDIVVEIEPLPKYDTPSINSWLLPISTAEYYVATYGGEEVVDWSPVTLNTGNSVKIRFDTTSFQSGAYKLRVKLTIPDGQVLISGWLRINVVGTTTA